MLKYGTKINVIRILAIICAAAAVAAGIASGEASAVYQKAVRICMECIGLG